MINFDLQVREFPFNSNRLKGGGKVSANSVQTGL